MNDFWKENDLDGSQGDLRALGHPQQPRQDAVGSSRNEHAKVVGPIERYLKIEINETI